MGAVVCRVSSGGAVCVLDKNKHTFSAISFESDSESPDPGSWILKPLPSSNLTAGRLMDESDYYYRDIIEGASDADSVDSR